MLKSAFGTAIAIVCLTLTAQAGAKSVGLANPASVSCGKKGGQTVIRTDAAGNQTGYCRLPNGRLCEEWALFLKHKCVRPKKG